MTDQGPGPAGMTIRIPDATRREAFQTALERAGTADWAGRLFQRDTTLWTEDPAVAPRSTIASAGSTPRPTSPSRCRPSRAS
jgi:hypothetical protein